MASRLDDAIVAYTKDRTDARFLSMYKTLLAEDFCVPVSEPVQEIQSGHHDVPVICMRMEDGTGALPVFTTMEHLVQWKPEGCLYISLVGRALIAMAIGMNDISEIAINPCNAPRGRIPRADFERMLALP